MTTMTVSVTVRTFCRKDGHREKPIKTGETTPATATMVVTMKCGLFLKRVCKGVKVALALLYEWPVLGVDKVVEYDGFCRSLGEVELIANGRLYALTVIYLLGYINRMVTTFEVLAEPTRRHILDLLRERERSVGELVEHLALSQPGVSKHLRVLREAGLAEVRHDAQRRWYGLRVDPLVEIDEWLEPYRRFWAGRLDALERHLDEQAKGEKT